MEIRTQARSLSNNHGASAVKRKLHIENNRPCEKKPSVIDYFYSQLGPQGGLKIFLHKPRKLFFYCFYFKLLDFSSNFQHFSPVSQQMTLVLTSLSPSGEKYLNFILQQQCLYHCLCLSFHLPSWARGGSALLPV